MDDLLDVLTLDQLRARTSVRWSHYPDDVLPDSYDMRLACTSGPEPVSIVDADDI